jgi:hypothetical protein
MLCTCTILYLLPSAIQLAYVNSPVCKVENNIRKLVLCKDVSYSPKPTFLWKHQFLCIIFQRNQLNLMGLVRHTQQWPTLPSRCSARSPSMDFTEIEPEELPPSQWEAAVQKKCQQVLAERNKALSAQAGRRSDRDPNQNDVDRSYLQKNFKAQSETAQKLIEDVIGKFELTSEQERAFRIIANHAVTPGSELVTPKSMEMWVFGLYLAQNWTESHYSSCKMKPFDILNKMEWSKYYVILIFGMQGWLST